MMFTSISGVTQKNNQGKFGQNSTFQQTLNQTQKHDLLIC